MRETQCRCGVESRLGRNSGNRVANSSDLRQVWREIRMLRSTRKQKVKQNTGRRQKTIQNPENTKKPTHKPN